MIGRNRTLISPKEVDARPVELVAQWRRRQELKQSARGRSARQRDGEATTRRQRCARTTYKLHGCRQAYLLGISKHSHDGFVHYANHRDTETQRKSRERRQSRSKPGIVSETLIRFSP